VAIDPGTIRSILIREIRVIRGSKRRFDKRRPPLLFFAPWPSLYSIVSPHVPSSNPRMVMLWGSLTAACMSGVFWLAIQMFRVVLRAQRAAAKK
jgi:hypothetical protein